MWTKTRFLQIAVVVLLLLNVASVVYFRMPPSRKAHGDALKNKVVKILSLDAAQVQAYEQLIVQHRAAVRAKEAEMLDSKKQLYQLLAGNSTQNADSLAQVIGHLQTEIEQIHFNHFSAVKNLCRPEQLGGFEAVTREMAHFFSNRRHAPAPRQ
jgi:periplasmic protein CpxP/Spy